MKTLTLSALLGALTLPSLSPLAAQAAAQPDFRWEKALAAGSRVRLHNLNGDITVTGGSGDKVEIVGVTRGTRGARDEVTIEVVETANGIVACSIHKRSDMECDEDGLHGNNRRRGRDRDDDWEDASIDMQVRAMQLRATEVEAHSVSGDVNVGIDALTGPGDLEFHSVSGNVTVTLPANTNADLSMHSVSGELDSDFPLTLTGRTRRSNIEARIGVGGRNLEVRTVSGDVRIRSARP